MSERKIRVLVAKPGLDGHDRGAKVIARALRDAGMEVIYTGLRQTPEQIVSTIIQEGVDALCLSILSGAHDYLFPRIMELMRRENLQDVLVLGGGVIPEEDVPGLIQSGVAGIYGSGTSTEVIVNAVREGVAKRSR
ncbi:MAG: cobalamin B12-binding domain-containing protein [Deltaproteobacteria bacterium]|nr:cobalamin B12-binding domain-containing protein [Deltaproteobacteria bacterium]